MEWFEIEEDEYHKNDSWLCYKTKKIWTSALKTTFSKVLNGGDR